MTAPTTSTTSHSSPTAQLQAQRFMAVAFIGTVPVFAIVAILRLGLGESPSPVVAAVLFVLNLIAFGLAELIGYRARPIPSGTEPQDALATGLGAMQESMTKRLVITEVPGFLALVWAFVEGSAWVFVIGGVWTLLSMVWHVWPTRRTAAKLERNLSRDGVSSGLVALFDRSGTDAPRA